MQAENLSVGKTKSYWTNNTETVDRIHAIKLELASVDKIGERANHRLAFELPFIAGAGGKADQRRAPMPVDDDAQLDAEPMRVPAVHFAFHRFVLMKAGKREYASGAGARRPGGLAINEQGEPKERITVCRKWLVPFAPQETRAAQ